MLNPEFNEKKRCCSVKTCPHFSGTTDPNIRFYITPFRDLELRNKWELAIFGKTNVQCFRLCHFHFNEEDFVETNKGIVLKKGAVPIPPVPETENEENIDKGSKSPQKSCVSCINYDVKLQGAYAKIDELKKKVNELQEENRIIKSQLRLITSEENLNRKCTLCKEKLTDKDFELHLCIDQESVECPLCPQSNPFNTTISLLKHIAEHTKNTQSIDNRLSYTYKCNHCNVIYPIKLLLELHKNAHKDIIQQPAELNIKVEPDEPDEPTLIDGLNSDEEYSVLVVVETDESSSDEVTFIEPIAQIESPDEIESQEDVGHSNGFDSSEEMDPSEEVDPSHEIDPLDNAEPSRNSIEVFNELSQPSSSEEKSHTLHHCYACQKTFKNPYELRVHIKKTHSEAPRRRLQRCKVCQVSLIRDELDTHMCDEKESIRCDYCPNEFTVTLELLQHLIESHQNTVSYQCEKCPEYFAMAALKEIHMKIHETEAQKPFACNICSKFFSNRKYLDFHRKTHDKIKPKLNLCDECGKRFSTARYLAEHKSSVHEKQRKFQCPDCPRKFFHKMNLRRHKETHGENEFICEICQAVLKSTSGYSKHMKIHQRTEADRKFACTVCPLKFFAPHRLRVHRRSHSTTKLFSCRFCDQSYKYSGDLNKHLKIHLGNKIYECSKCSERFQYPMELQKHENQHYKEEKAANGTTE